MAAKGTVEMFFERDGGDATGMFTQVKHYNAQAHINTYIHVRTENLEHTCTHTLARAQTQVEAWDQAKRNSDAMQIMVVALQAKNLTPMDAPISHHGPGSSDPFMEMYIEQRIMADLDQHLTPQGQLEKEALEQQSMVLVCKFFCKFLKFICLPTHPYPSQETRPAWARWNMLHRRRQSGGVYDALPISYFIIGPRKLSLLDSSNSEFAL